MADLTLIGYWDKSASHADYRIMLFPPGGGGAQTLVPEFGALPATGSNFHRLPDRAFALVAMDPTGDGSAIVAGDGKFGDGLPWGMAETSSYQLQAFPEAMQATTTDQDFASYLIDDIWSFEQGTVTVTSGVTYAFDLPARFVVLRGATGAAIADFTVRFDGGLRAVPTQKWTITPGVGAVLDLEMDHTAKIVLDTVKMSWVCQRALDITYTDEFPTAPDSPDFGDAGIGYDRVYDAVWGSTTDVYAWMFEPQDQRVVGYHRAHLMLAAEQLCNEVYSSMTGQSSASAHFHFQSASYGSAEGYNATPWDHWTLYEQSTVNTIDGTAPPFSSPMTRMERGDAFNGRWGKFIGTVALDSDTSDYIAGLLIAGAQSLHQYPTLWDFLVEACDEAGCKGIVTTPAQNEVSIVFRALAESTSTTTLTIDSFRSKADPSSPPETIDMEVGAAAVLTVDASVRQSFGDDNGAYNTSEGARTEGGAAIKCIFDTAPVVGPSEWKAEASSEDWPSASLFCAANLRQWPFWKLYYSAEILGSVRRVMIRVHDSVRIDDGGGTPVDYGTGGAAFKMPLPTLGGFATAFTTQQMWDDFVKPIRLNWISRQRTSSSHYAIAQHVMARFGASRKPVTIRGTIPASLVSMDRLGDRVRIGPSPYVASNLVNTGATYLDTLSADGDLVSLKIDDVSGLADIEIVTGDTTS